MLIRQPMPKLQKSMLLNKLVNEQEDKLKECTSEWVIDNVLINHLNTHKKPFVTIETSCLEPFKYCLN
jgi:hypothetical protein